MIIIGISLSLLVIVAGMFLFAKSKKDELGGIFKVTSYITVVAGILLLLGALCIGLCKMAHCGSSSHGCGKSSYHQGFGQHSGSTGFGCSKQSSYTHQSGSSCAHGQQHSCGSSCRAKAKGHCSKASHGKASSCSKSGKKVTTKTNEKEGDKVEIEEDIVEEK